MVEDNKWLASRIGMFSASGIADLMTKGRAKDKAWGDSAITYLYKVEFDRMMKQRVKDYTGYHSDSPAMRFGRENEIWAVEWLRQNVNRDIKYYETDFHDSEGKHIKPFLTVEWAAFGATPDTALVDENDDPLEIWEIKCCFSESQIYRYFSPTRDYEKKKADAAKEHLDQVCGQFLACPKCDTIHILKYNPQRDTDDCDWDIEDIADPSRGILFDFHRAELLDYLDEVKERIIFADMHLDSGEQIELINQRWNDLKNE